MSHEHQRPATALADPWTAASRRSSRDGDRYALTGYHSHTVNDAPPVDPHVVRKLTHLRAAFISKFGREPTPGDPLVFDPDASTPQPYARPPAFKQAVRDRMVAAGIAAHLIYAYERTGLLVSQQVKARLSADELAAYKSAIDEYFALEYWRQQNAG
jgi:hypothetical protein